ncbi:SGNH/GDSL hydrolase family protein [Aeromicrobium sp.]|uniref:SGNH/GDSL hydrolase family protein n=1 Tax=Aeromicrobium sp. TaxID=1871063 RepID=UPI001999BB0C|nr:SGNH/GDSL hydrolase family protein [Aeromicrobium sp.]MBC7633649.1 SGNH/GDSL hydrolase family protein [Aeromicrobium sp.]
MTMPRTAVRPTIVVSFVLAVIIAPFIAWQGAQGGEQASVSALAPLGIVVVGDSITARYNDTPGDLRQGWWSIVGRRFGAHVTTYAQSGSGYLRSGHGPAGPCSGDRLIDRDAAFTGPPPSMLIIEAGRNDWSFCRRGRYVEAPDIMIDRAVNRYLDVLQTFLPSSTRIIVMGPPWGPLDQIDGLRITMIIKDAATRHGLQFIDTRGTLTTARVLDGVHPNRAGSVAIADRVIRSID